MLAAATLQIHFDVGERAKSLHAAVSTSKTEAPSITKLHQGGCLQMFGELTPSSLELNWPKRQLLLYRWFCAITCMFSPRFHFVYCILHTPLTLLSAAFMHRSFLQCFSTSLFFLFPDFLSWIIVFLCFAFLNCFF